MKFEDHRRSLAR